MTSSKCSTEEPVKGSVGHAATGGIDLAARLRSTTSGDDAVHLLNALGQTVGAGRQLQPVDGARGQNTRIGGRGGLDVARLVHAAEKLGGGQVKDGHTVGVKVVVAQERSGAGQGTGQSEGSGGQKGAGDDGAVVGLGENVGRGGRAGAGGAGGLEVQGDVLAVEDRVGDGVKGGGRHARLDGARVQSGDIVEDGEGTSGDGRGGGGGAGVVLDAVADGDLEQRQASSGSRELGT